MYLREATFVLCSFLSSNSCSSSNRKHVLELASQHVHISLGISGDNLDFDVILTNSKTNKLNLGPSGIFGPLRLHTHFPNHGTPNSCSFQRTR
jgi:hypothetical protein